MTTAQLLRGNRVHSWRLAFKMSAKRLYRQPAHGELGRSLVLCCPKISPPPALVT